MSLRVYRTRYVHKISSSANNTGPEVALSGPDRSSSNMLGKALRKYGVLSPGAKVRNYRIEPDGKIVIFPSMPLQTSYWHAIVLTPA